MMLGDTVDGRRSPTCARPIDDDQVEIDVVERDEPSPISPTATTPFGLIGVHDRRGVPGRRPGAVRDDGATDSRLFTRICERVYRFAPFRMTKAQREAIHSYDEHLGVDAFLDGVRWYRRLIERLPGDRD